MKQELPQEYLRELEKVGVAIQVAMATSSLAGLAGILASPTQPTTFSLTWFAALLFAISIPCALSRSLMGYLAGLSSVFFHPVSWLLYPLGIMSCLATTAGYTLILWNLSIYHGLSFLGMSVIGLIWFIIHAVKIRNELKKRQQIFSGQVKVDAASMI